MADDLLTCVSNINDNVELVFYKSVFYKSCSHYEMSCHSRLLENFKQYVDGSGPRRDNIVLLTCRGPCPCSENQGGQI